MKDISHEFKLLENKLNLMPERRDKNVALVRLKSSLDFVDEFISNIPTVCSNCSVEVNGYSDAYLDKRLRSLCEDCLDVRCIELISEFEKKNSNVMNLKKEVSSLKKDIENIKQFFRNLYDSL